MRCDKLIRVFSLKKQHVFVWHIDCKTIHTKKPGMKKCFMMFQIWDVPGQEN
jgi:hypothetical protein